MRKQIILFAVAALILGEFSSARAEDSAAKPESTPVVAGFSGMSHGTGANSGGAQVRVPSTLKQQAKHRSSASAGAEITGHRTGANRVGIVTGQIRAGGQPSTGQNPADNKSWSGAQHDTGNAKINGKAAYTGAGTGISGNIGSGRPNDLSRGDSSAGSTSSSVK